MTKNEKYEKALIIAIETLGFYAQPENYHAIAIVGDRPCGEFAYDVSMIKRYDRKMPGKLARTTLNKIQKIVLG